MLSSINQYVRMLDGRDRGTVVEVNREIALDLIERKEAIGIDVTAKNALEPWDAERLAEFRGGLDLGVKVPVGEVPVPKTSVEVSLPRATVKTKKR